MEKPRQILSNLTIFLGVLFVIPSCIKTSNVSGHSHYAAYIGKQATLKERHILYRNTAQSKKFRDYRIAFEGHGDKEKLGEIEAGSRLKIDKIVSDNRGGLYSIIALGTIRFKGRIYPFEHILRIDSKPINPAEYPLPYRIVGP